MATESPELYLIAHKVRGELAWDIAHRLQIGDEQGWIVSTSGHRAYPTQYWLLENLFDGSDYPHNRPAEYEPQADWDVVPDHYETVADKGRGKITGLSALLGVKRPTLEIKRRL